MKSFITFMVLFCLSISAQAADKVDTAPVGEGSPAAGSVEPVKEPKNEKSAVSETKPAEPAATAPAVKASSATAPAVKASSATVVTSTAAKVEPAAKTVAVSTPSVPSIPQLQSLLGFHEKEIASLKVFNERSSKDLGATLAQREDIEKKITDSQIKIVMLKKENTKASKKEADKVKKEESRLTKELKAIDNTIKEKRKKLAREIEDLSSQTSRALQQAYEQAASDLVKPKK